MAKENTQNLGFPRLRVTAIIEDNGKYLLLEEPIKTEGNDYYWLFPGGGVKEKETLVQALDREVTEETNLKIELVKKLKFNERSIPEKDFHAITFYFLVKKISGELKQEANARAVGWFNKEEALKLNLWGSSRDVIEEYLS